VSTLRSRNSGDFLVVSQTNHVERKLNATLLFVLTSPIAASKLCERNRHTVQDTTLECHALHIYLKTRLASAVVRHLNTLTNLRLVWTML